MRLCLTMELWRAWNSPRRLGYLQSSKYACLCLLTVGKKRRKPPHSSQTILMLNLWKHQLSTMNKLCSRISILYTLNVPSKFHIGYLLLRLPRKLEHWETPGSWAFYHFRGMDGEILGVKYLLQEWLLYESEFLECSVPSLFSSTCDTSKVPYEIHLPSEIPASEIISQIN